jgi:putative restriction endonuclease
MATPTGGRIRPPTAFVGLTDWDWFERLGREEPLDEVNFWQPSSGGGFAALQPGEPLLFKLHKPRDLIAGCGFFAQYSRLPMDLAWEAFGVKNGVASLEEMHFRIQRYRRVSPAGPEAYEIGCVVLEQPVFLEESDWIEAPEWKPNIQRGRTYRLDQEPGLTMWQAMEMRILSRKGDEAGIRDAVRERISPRYGAPVFSFPRLGQGSFQVAVVDAYRRRCAITGEKVLPVLEAAHIKPYAEGGEHRVDNGLLLRSDIHTLFDWGYLTVTPRLEVVVSTRLQTEFHNGAEYVAMAGRHLNPPAVPDQRPNPEFLDWHNDHRFVG